MIRIPRSLKGLLTRLALPALMVIGATVLATSAVTAATPPQPAFGTAQVDGVTSEWDLSGDFFAKMYRAFDPSKQWQSDLYLRYSCADQTLSALVLALPQYPVQPTAGDAWLKVDGVPGNLIDGTDASFAWVTSAGNPIGWEGSAHLAPGSYNITAHIEVIDGTGQTSGTTGSSARTSIPLVIECAAAPVERPSVSIVKDVNGQDANVAPGIFVLAGDAVNWTYVVANTGDVALSDVVVTDDRGVAVTCQASALAVGASMTCTGSGTAVTGQYTNIGTVTAKSPAGSDVTASDPANYFGAVPSVTITKAVNGDDANAAPGPMLLAGSAVSWTYSVTNTGNVALTNVAVTDDKGVAVSCPSATLVAGSSMTCTGHGTVVSGQYTNIGTVTGTAPVGPAVTASDPANYFGADPKVAIVKAVNGNDANAAPGIYLPVGSTVTWTYTVTNTGNVALTGVTVSDDKGVVVACPANTLDVGASMVCRGSATVVAGQYTNIGTATATAPVGPAVTANDPANYFGVVLGKTMGFWGNNNGVARINGAGGYGSNAVTLGLASGRNVLIDMQAESLKVLPNSLNACGKGTPAIFGTATSDCTVAKGINANSLNTLAGQTLALSYNVRLVTGYNGQTIGQLQAAGSVGILPLTANSTVGDVLAMANQVIATSASGGTATQGQVGALNTLLGTLNREAW